MVRFVLNKIMEFAIMNVTTNGPTYLGKLTRNTCKFYSEKALSESSVVHSSLFGRRVSNSGLFRFWS